MSRNTIRFLLLGIAILVGLSAFNLTSIISLASKMNNTEDAADNHIDRNGLSIGSETALPQAELYSYNSEGIMKAAELYDASYTANYSVNGSQPSNSGTDHNTFSKGGEYTIGYRNNLNEVIKNGVSSENITGSSFVLLACSFAVLGAAFLFIRTRSKYLI